MKPTTTSITTTTTAIELIEKDKEQIIHFGLGAALAGLFGTINDDGNNNNPFHVKIIITVDETHKLEEKLIEGKKATLVASK